MLHCDGIALVQGDFRLRADIAFATGAVTALIGPSGAGKSTLLSAMAGFTPVHSGAFRWGDTDLTNLSPAQRPISILFQDNNLFPHLTIAQNVGLGLRGDMRLSSAQWTQVSDVLAQVGLAGFDTRKSANLSGGQQSRAALARVLIAGRPIALLDEPFAALGPALKDEMLDLLRAMLCTNWQTVIMVTHDPADAKRIADAASLVADGVVSVPVPTTDLFADPPPALREYLGNES